MRTNITIYILSLALLIAGISIVAVNPSSERMQVIAGGLAFLGLALNILSFVKTYLQTNTQLNKKQ
ncbi:hypothetical protein [Draconibacterium halophilum]|uniref:Uncharacterized protein n=1 Tax=Draconibacterium halophilum TaxID=2706887 RepID=A0A6C0RED4_9BACT|nr:hypothetical protein [Draconibacterium halophilum]QIA08740.1 hypothetical protein G0Q07_13875 [Draconibacterium halophilum]